LAQQYTYDREEYTNAKGEFVNQILKLAQQNEKTRTTLKIKKLAAYF